MANVRNRFNSNTKNITKGNGRVGRPKKSSGVSNTKNTPKQVKKSPRSIKSNKMQPIGNEVTDVFMDKLILNNDKLQKDIHFYKRKKLESQCHNKSKPNLKLYDKILKSELLIDDSKKPQNPENAFNNNDLKITDQNKDSFIDDSLNNITSKLGGYKDSKNAEVKKVDNYSEETIIRPKRRRPYNQNIKVICDYCQKEFHNKCALRRHIYLHLNLKSYPCKQCGKAFRKQLYLSAHSKRQHPNWNKHYMCKICDKPFLLEDNLKLHLASHTRIETMFKCIYCTNKYSDQHKLVQHEKKHLISGRYPCQICELDFDCRNRLTLHFKSHLRVKDYICQHCGKEFVRLNSMRRHVSICHSGKRIQCPICKKYLKGHLTEHLRTHEKNRPHVCPDCGQRFTQSTQLKVHRRAHTGVRPYPCRICSRPFSHSNALMLHIRRHTGEKPFHCALCPLSFSQLPHMKAHMKNIHGKENPYLCQKCKQFFKLKIDLENHVKTCTVGEKVLTIEEEILDDVLVPKVEADSAMTLTRMRFLLALLLTMIATKEKLKYLGFNKRLIDDLLIESLEGMGHETCKDETLTPLKRLKTNIEILLNGTVPKEKMAKFRKENKTTEELLELLTEDGIANKN